jgi:hypothetical protein
VSAAFCATHPYSTQHYRGQACLQTKAREMCSDRACPLYQTVSPLSWQGDSQRQAWPGHFSDLVFLTDQMSASQLWQDTVLLGLCCCLSDVIFGWMQPQLILRALCLLYWATKPQKDHVGLYWGVLLFCLCVKGWLHCKTMKHCKRQCLKLKH